MWKYQQKVYVYKGKYGPVAQVGEDDQIQFIKIPEDMNLNSITIKKFNLMNPKVGERQTQS